MGGSARRALVCLLLAGCTGVSAERGSSTPSTSTARPESAARPAATLSRPTSPPPSSAGYDAAGEEIADDIDAPVPSTPQGKAGPHPLDDFSEERLAQAVADAPETLGSISLGTPNAGRLLGAVQMPEGEGWILVDPEHAWGTQETVDSLMRAIEQVRATHTGSPPLPIGHISARAGGRLSPHLSHQSGRDVDVGYYYSASDQIWYRRARASNLDRARTWTFIRALLTLTDVEMILIDRSIQRLLRQHARSAGEDEAWLASVFDGAADGRRAIIRHAAGHATHIHIRFYSPIARETARRTYHLLVKAGLTRPVLDYLRYRVRAGDTLGKLSARFGTSVEAIREANQLRSNLIRAGRVYLIPRPTTPRPLTEKVVTPPRRLPPEP